MTAPAMAYCIACFRPGFNGSGPGVRSTSAPLVLRRLVCWSLHNDEPFSDGDFVENDLGGGVEVLRRDFRKVLSAICNDKDTVLMLFGVGE